MNNWMLRRIRKVLPRRRELLAEDCKLHARMFNACASGDMAASAHVSGCMAQTSMVVGENSAVVDVISKEGALVIGRDSMLKHVDVSGNVVIGDGCVITNSKIVANNTESRVHICSGCVLGGCNIEITVPGEFVIGEGAVWECCTALVDDHLYYPDKRRYLIGRDSMLVNAQLECKQVKSLRIGDRFTMVKPPPGSTLLGFMDVTSDRFSSDRCIVQAMDFPERSSAFSAALTLSRYRGNSASMLATLGDDVLVWGKWTISTKKDLCLGSGVRLWNETPNFITVSRRSMRMGRDARLFASPGGGKWTQNIVYSGRTVADLIIEDGGQLSLSGHIGTGLGSVFVPAGSMVI